MEATWAGTRDKRKEENVFTQGTSLSHSWGTVLEIRICLDGGSAPALRTVSLRHKLVLALLGLGEESRVFRRFAKRD